MNEQFEIKWFDRHRLPHSPSDPTYPEGIDLDISGGAMPSCVAKLPYPPEHKTIGYYLIFCRICRRSAVVTTASRPDDPRSIKLACNPRNDRRNEHDIRN